MIQTELCKLAWKYGSDKCPRIKHHYTPFYYDLFNPIRDKVKKVFEIGVGYKEDMLHVPDHYLTGASLYMWRDFFPNATIYGADIKPFALIQEDRIESYYADQSKDKDLQRVIDIIGTDLDIVIDDGSHVEVDQLSTARYLLPLLKKGCIYVIEDTSTARQQSRILGRKYTAKAISFPKTEGKIRDDNLVVIKT